MRSDPPFRGSTRTAPRTIYTFRVRALDPQGGVAPYSFIPAGRLGLGPDNRKAAKRNCSVFQYGRGGGNLSLSPARSGQSWGGPETKSGSFFYLGRGDRSFFYGEDRGDIGRRIASGSARSALNLSNPMTGKAPRDNVRHSRCVHSDEERRGGNLGAAKDAHQI